ncbi:MAG: type II toxin-antitoxin system RelE/ParE family toxin [Bacteroidia bacterium]
MKLYEIIIVKSAVKQLQSIPTHYREKIIQKVDALSSNPRPHGVEKLTNRDNEYRIRIGVYRVIYSIFDEKLIVEVVDIDHRKQIYK